MNKYFFQIPKISDWYDFPARCKCGCAGCYWCASSCSSSAATARSFSMTSPRRRQPGPKGGPAVAASLWSLSRPTAASNSSWRTGPTDDAAWRGTGGEGAPQDPPPPPLGRAAPRRRVREGLRGEAPPAGPPPPREGQADHHLNRRGSHQAASPQQGRAQQGRLHQERAQQERAQQGRPQQGRAQQGRAQEGLPAEGAVATPGQIHTTTLARRTLPALTTATAATDRPRATTRRHRRDPTTTTSCIGCWMATSMESATIRQLPLDR